MTTGTPTTASLSLPNLPERTTLCPWAATIPKTPITQNSTNTRIRLDRFYRFTFHLDSGPACGEANHYQFLTKEKPIRPTLGHASTL